MSFPAALWKPTASAGFRQLSFGHLLGFESRYELDGFLKAHDVWLYYGVEDLERDREAHRNLGL